MSNQILSYSILILSGTFVAAISQAMLKKASQKHYDHPLKEYFNPLVIIAYLLFFFTTLLSIIAYKVVPLSFGPILEATSYIYVTFFGVKFFGEIINRKKIVGMVFIIVGITIYALFG